MIAAEEFVSLLEQKDLVSPEIVAHLRRQIARPGDLTKSCLIVEKARQVLGWRPETDLKTGIHATLAWRLNPA